MLPISSTTGAVVVVVSPADELPELLFPVLLQPAAAQAISTAITAATVLFIISRIMFSLSSLIKIFKFL